MKKIISTISFSSLLMFSAHADEIKYQEPFIPAQTDSFQSYSYRPKKDVMTATGFSCLFPGLGHAYLNDNQTFAGLAGTAALGLGATGFGVDEASTVVMNTWFYGIYASYRDARIYNNQKGYSYQMPEDSLKDLASAPFSWSVIKKPEVWGGLIGMFGTAVLITSFYSESLSSPMSLSLSSARDYAMPLAAFPVGIGEEALFRGFIQSQAAEYMPVPGAIALTSTLFGAAHMPKAAYMNSQDRRYFYSVVIPFLSASGAYMGWLTHKNHSLKESVALHAWYDFILFALAVGAGQSVGIEDAQFGLHFQF